MPHIAPSTWAMICLLSFFMISVIFSKLTWSFFPTFPKVKGVKKFQSSWPWN